MEIYEKLREIGFTNKSNNLTKFKKIINLFVKKYSTSNPLHVEKTINNKLYQVMESYSAVTCRNYTQLRINNILVMDTKIYFECEILESILIAEKNNYES